MKTKKTILSLLTLALVGAGVSVAAPAQAGTGGELFNANLNGKARTINATGGPNASQIYSIPAGKNSNGYAPNATGFSVPARTCVLVIVDGVGPAKKYPSGYYKIYGDDNVWVRDTAC